jgi:cytochrome c5
MDARQFGLLAIAVSIGVAAVTACAGPPAGVISFTEATASSEQNATETDNKGNKKDESPAPSGGAVNTVFKSKVYSAVQATCESCHLAGVGGAPIFFGDDDAATYALFKQKGYHLPNNAFLNKPVHNGPALTAEQKTLVNEWIAAEGAGTPDGG